MCGKLSEKGIEGIKQNESDIQVSYLICYDNSKYEKNKEETACLNYRRATIFQSKSIRI